MTIIARRTASCLTVALALLATPSPARAQDDRDPPTVAALTAALDSADLSVRAVAVAALSAKPPTDLPIVTRRKLVALLEREATSPRPQRDDDGEDGEMGPYLTQLVRAVVRLREPSSARGLALLGLATSAEAQRFVASRGDAAVALLDEAEQADTSNRGPVSETRGRMLGDYPSLLSPESRIAVRAAVLRLAPVDPLAFAHAAEFGRLVEVVPVLAPLASSADEFDRSILAGTAEELTALRSQTTPATILDGLTASIAALCEGAQGSRRGACQSITRTVTNALDEVRAGRPAAANGLLHALGTVADDALRRGAITPLENAMIAGTAAYLATRI